MAPRKEIPSLVRALDFIAFAQKDKGAPYQTHVALGGKMAVAHDGVLSAGHSIDEDLVACPHTVTLLAALKKCAGVLSVAQLDSGKLSVKSGKFKAFVPCLPNATLPGIGPDPKVGVIDNRIRDGLAVLSPLVVENSQRVITASVLLRSRSMVATNGNVLLEYWHGIDLPPGLIIPKVFINALLKITKPLVAFGFSQSTFTVYFDDDSWLKTQLYNDKWPDCDAILNKPNNPVELPKGLFDAINIVAGFVEDNRIRLCEGRVNTHAHEGVGASYEVAGLQANVSFNVKHILLLEGRIKTIDFVGEKGISYFYGDNLRGAITQIKD